ncbi:MAG TPA: hypothetical protein VEM95_06055 [Thermoplasmata archaeon]|nr:hypothetical protein [Thermoplasmata archaeon]
MPVCPSCGNEFLVLCADDGLCRNCSACCGGTANVTDLRDAPRKLT